MIQREWQTVKLQTFTSGVDSYGQRKTGTATETDIQMVLRTYSQSNVQDPRYVNAELTGLTEADVTTDNRIKVGSVVYDVLYVIPDGRLKQVFMRKKA